MTEFDVVIVGAGVAGASAAYHLAQATSNSAKVLVLDAAPEPGEGLQPRGSGSATMKGVAPCIKMMVLVYAGSSAAFVKHHGEKGATRYLNATREGLRQQKATANVIWGPNDGDHLRPLGSYYVAYEEDEDDLRNEFEQLRVFGCEEIEWCDKTRLGSVDGLCRGFHCAIFFPDDAVIDSSLYAKTLLKHVVKNSNGQTQLNANTRVKKIVEEEQCALVELDTGTTICARNVVMATGGLFQIPELNGILKPCYSYLVHVPIDGHSCNRSANFFTWGFSHDWCFTNGKIRCSGEDHFSAYKPPLCAERCARLSKWTRRQYDCDTDPSRFDDASIPQQYGIYSETPDMVPLIGSLTNNSRICYLLGCNAWGQTVLSYCSTLVPALLGYTELSDEQTDCMRLFTIRRFTQLPRLFN